VFENGDDSIFAAGQSVTIYFTKVSLVTYSLLLMGVLCFRSAVFLALSSLARMTLFEMFTKAKFVGGNLSRPSRHCSGQTTALAGCPCGWTCSL